MASTMRGMRGMLQQNETLQFKETAPSAADALDVPDDLAPNHQAPEPVEIETSAVACDDLATDTVDDSEPGSETIEADLGYKNCPVQPADALSLAPEAAEAEEAHEALVPVLEDAPAENVAAEPQVEKKKKPSKKLGTEKKDTTPETT